MSTADSTGSDGSRRSAGSARPALPGDPPGGRRATWVWGIGVAVYVVKLAVGGLLLVLFETATAKMRVFRVPLFLGAALMLGLLGTLLLFIAGSH